MVFEACSRHYFRLRFEASAPGICFATFGIGFASSDTDYATSVCILILLRIFLSFYIGSYTIQLIPSLFRLKREILNLFWRRKLVPKIDRYILPLVFRSLRNWLKTWTSILSRNCGYTILSSQVVISAAMRWSLHTINRRSRSFKDASSLL